MGLSNFGAKKQIKPALLDVFLFLALYYGTNSPKNGGLGLESVNVKILVSRDMRITIKNLPFLLIDLASFYLALLISLKIRLGGGFSFDALNFHFRAFGWPIFFLVVLFFVLGLYDLRNIARLFKYFRTWAMGIAIFFLFATFYFYFLPETDISPKTILVLMVLVFGIANFGLREILRRYLIKSQPLVEVLLVGKGEDATELYKYVGDNPQMGYRIETWIKEYDIHAIDGALNENRSGVIVIPSQLKTDKYFADKIYTRLIEGAEVVGFSEFYENILGKVSMDELKENWFVEKLRPRDGLYGLLKRLSDVFLAFLVLVTTIIFWPFIAVIIKTVSPGQVFFLKERVGLGGKRFLLYKFRTMHDGHEEKTEIKENFAEERGDQKRTFGFGKFLRRMRIDEWPQVINVLKGELSFVGPRVDFADYYELLKDKIPYYQIRTIIMPGLSGWAQIHNKGGNSIETARERLAYDIYYIKNRSLILDLAISLKTLKTVLMFSGT